MKTVSEQLVSRKEIELFLHIRQVNEAMPEVDLGESNGEKVDVSCHMLARAIATFFPVQYKDGYFGQCGWQHSWLVTKEGNIIDVYPWATIGGPTFLVTTYFSPWPRLFREAKLSQTETGEFKRHTAAVTCVVGETIQRLGICIFCHKAFDEESSGGYLYAHKECTETFEAECDRNGFEALASRLPIGTRFDLAGGAACD